MIKDPYAKERRAYHLTKRHSEKLIKETEERLVQQIADIPEPVIPEPVPIESIAAQVMALLPKPKKLKNKKKAAKGLAVVTPEDVMAMIMASLEDVKKEYTKTGDTVVINEAPQRVIETVREIIRETGGEVDYEQINKELDRRFIEWRQSFTMSGGASSLSQMTDVRLDGLPQDEQGNYLLGQTVAQSFETVSKNLNSYPFTINYSGSQVSSVVYTVPDGTITKSITYDVDNNVESVTLSGDLPSSITATTKTITYSGGKISSVDYT
jgi:hypothetical protein